MIGSLMAGLQVKGDVMAGYEQDVKRILSGAGCSLVRQGRGDHEIWFSPLTGRPFVVKAHRMRSRHTANETLKQAGLPKRF